MTPMPIASSGSGASPAASSPIIISAKTLSRCSLMPESTSRRLLGPLMICFVISVVLLRLTKLLPSYRLVPHDQLAALRRFQSYLRESAAVLGVLNAHMDDFP